MLTIALDAEHTRHSNAGIARYSRSLATALRKQSGVRLIELGGGEVVRRGTVRKKITTARHDLLWYPVLARRTASRLGADIYHSPLLRGPLTKGKPPFVMTVHDAVPVRNPETMPRWHRAYTALVLRRLLDAADRIITPSQNTADDLSMLLGIQANKIRVIPNGVDQIFFDSPRINKNNGAAAGSYILFVGTPEPRKNLSRLLKAVRILRGRGFSERLLLVGSGGWGRDAISGSETGVQALGRVTDSELASLYAHAACLALPSLHEGFGLPALEAMAAGTPVVAGNAGALPEVTGGAAVLVDPESEIAIADGIARALSERDRLTAAGRARARQFTWERAAALTAEVYRELA